MNIMYLLLRYSVTWRLGLSLLTIRTSKANLHTKWNYIQLNNFIFRPISSSNTRLNTEVHFILLLAVCFDICCVVLWQILVFLVHRIMCLYILVDKMANSKTTLNWPRDLTLLVAPITRYIILGSRLDRYLVFDPLLGSGDFVPCHKDPLR